MFEFGSQGYLYMLLLIPVFYIIFLLSRYRRKKILQKYGDTQVIKTLMPEVSTARPRIKFFLLMLAFIALVIALARPRFGSKLKNVKREGVEIIIALDVSNSMRAQDIKPDRLERAKRAISQMTDHMKNDKVGLLVFAGDAYTQVPITSDYEATKLFLSAVNTDIVSKQGTAIGSAVELGMDSFTPDEETSKALIVITDGENHEGNAVSAAKKAAEKGIKVYTIGMGLPDGAPIPAQKGGNKYLQENGETVISKLDEQTLKEIAAAGDGSYVRANNIRTGVNTIFDKINQLEEKEMETKVYSQFDEKFIYFAALALFFLILEFLIMEKSNTRLSNLKIFEGRK